MRGGCSERNKYKSLKGFRRRRGAFDFKIKKRQEKVAQISTIWQHKTRTKRFREKKDVHILWNLINSLATNWNESCNLLNIHIYPHENNNNNMHLVMWSEAIRILGWVSYAKIVKFLGFCLDYQFYTHHHSSDWNLLILS